MTFSNADLVNPQKANLTEIFLPWQVIPLYGVPKLRMDVVRCADMNRTPDIRSRPFFEQWAMEFDVRYVSPQLSANTTISLLHNAGMLCGVGDFRQEKGKGSFGLFRVIGDQEMDDEWNYLKEHCGREAQLSAIENPEFADQDTADLIDYWHEEVARRSDAQPAAPAKRGRRGNGAGADDGLQAGL